MKIRLYFDEDAMSHRLADELKIRGVDVLTTLEADMIEQPDEIHLAFATDQNRVLYSFNVADYHFLHQQFLSQGKRHAGIMLAQQQRFTIGEQLRRLMRFVTLVSAEEMQNRVEFLSAWG
jgi:hypothetical protein